MPDKSEIVSKDTAPDQEDDSSRSVIRRIEIRIPEAKEPERIDVFLARQVAELTRSKAQDAINEGAVKVNDAKVKTSYKVRPNDLIRLEVLSRPPFELEAEDIPLDVVWEDKWLVVINKPAGMIVHPAGRNRSGTLVNALLGHYGDLEESDDPDRPGVVHRLDKQTSGLLVVCKREPALSKLAAQFRNHKVQREYRAIIWWLMPQPKGIVDQPIGRDPRNRKKYVVHQHGKPARTHWEVLESFDYLSYLKLSLETGRTHQIRVHMSHEGHPVFGDPDYAGRNRQLGRLTSGQRRQVASYFECVTRQMLHARTLGFKHPVTGEMLTFEADLPDDFRWLLEELRANAELKKNARLKRP